MQEKIIELKRVQSILSRPTKHDKPPGIGLNAFLPPNCQVAKTEGNNALPGPSGDLFVEIFAKTNTQIHKNTNTQLQNNTEIIARARQKSF